MNQYQKVQIEELLDIFDSLRKSEDSCGLEKGVGSKIHKYIQKIGDKYIYEQPRKTKTLNEHREYLQNKTSLDSIASHANKANWSETNRESYKHLNILKDKFKDKYGHKHDSEEAEHTKRMTIAAMHNYINNRVQEIEEKQENMGILEKSEGSRGGKVIGHTKSGKPIYESHEQSHTQHYTAEDHSDAVSAHMKEASRHSEKSQKYLENYDGIDPSDRKDQYQYKRAGEHADKASHHSQTAELHSTAMNQKLDKNMKKSENIEVLGYTRTGKLVYNSSDIELYKGYSVVDHKEAAVIHTLQRDRFEAAAFRSGTQVEKSRNTSLSEDHLAKSEFHSFLANESKVVQKSDSERGFVTTLSTGKKLHSDPYSDFNKGFSREEHLEASNFYKSQSNLLPTLASEVTKRANIHMFLMDKNLLNKSYAQDLGEDSLEKGGKGSGRKSSGDAHQDHRDGFTATEQEILQKSITTIEESDLLYKGGKRALIGEVRVYNNGEKWKKTSDGWDQVKDIHNAKAGDHHVKVNKVDKDTVHFDVHDNDGNFVTSHKLDHSKFRENYTPKEIHEVSLEGGAAGTEHVSSYHIGEETSPLEEILIRSPHLRTLSNFVSSAIDTGDKLELFHADGSHLNNTLKTDENYSDILDILETKGIVPKTIEKIVVEPTLPLKPTLTPLEALNKKTKELVKVEQDLSDHNRGVVDFSDQEVKDLKLKKQVLVQIIDKLEVKLKDKISDEVLEDKKAAKLAQKEVKDDEIPEVEEKVGSELIDDEPEESTVPPIAELEELGEKLSQFGRVEYNKKDIIKELSNLTYNKDYEPISDLSKLTQLLNFTSDEGTRNYVRVGLKHLVEKEPIEEGEESVVSPYPENDVRSLTSSETSDLWPDKLEYKGFNVFDLYIDDNFFSKLEDAVGIGSMQTVEEEEWDEEEEEFITSTSEEETRGQESYLGYDPDTDTFISGFDMFNDAGGTSGLVSFKISDEGVPKIIKTDEHYSGMMYESSKRGGYDHLHNKHKNLVDIRLD